MAENPERRWFVYLIENSINNKLYVGQTIRPEKRLQEHIKWHRYALGEAIQKYGADKFELVVLEACSSLEETNAREKYWIEVLGTISPKGYNLSPGGDGAGYRPSEEAKRKRSTASLGEKNPFYGKTHSKETIEKLKNRYISPETRAKISQAKKGRKAPPELREKLSMLRRGTLNHFYGKTHAPETRQKIREARLEKGKALLCERGHSFELYAYTNPSTGKRYCTLCRRLRRAGALQLLH